MANENQYAVGDIFEGSPVQLNRWLSPIWAIGGKVEIYGNVATILWLPTPEPFVPDPLVKEYFETFTKQLSPVEDVIVEEDPILPVVIHATKEEVEAIKLVPNISPEPTKYEQYLASKDPPAVPVVVDPGTKASRGRPKKTVNPVDRVN